MKLDLSRKCLPWLFTLAPFLVPAAAAQQTVNVEWAETVNVTATENSLAKTDGCDGCDDAGARSLRQLESGNVYVEFRVPDVDPTFLVGLSNGNPGTTDEEIDFSLRFQFGNVEVRENGVYKADVRANNGDQFRISVENGVVSYYHNGMHFYTSEQQPQYPLLVDVSMLSMGSRVENVVAVPFGGQNQTAFSPFQGTPDALRQGQQGQQGQGETVNLQWVDVVNAQDLGNALVKTAGCDGCTDAGARSQQALASGNVYVEFSVPDVTKLLWAGLTNEPSVTNPETLDFSIRTQNGVVEVRENGEYRAAARAANGDRFRISVKDGVVSYFRNEEAFHTSSRAVEYPLYMAATLGGTGAAVANAVAVPFSDDEGIAFQPWR